MAQQPIIGLKLAIEDQETGSSAEWHVIESYHVYKYANQTQATFATYVSQSKYAEGKQPVGRSLTIAVGELPPTDTDIEQWLYQAAVAPAAEDNDNPSPLVGAELVRTE